MCVQQGGLLSATRFDLSNAVARHGELHHIPNFTRLCSLHFTLSYEQLLIELFTTTSALPQTRRLYSISASYCHSFTIVLFLPSCCLDLSLSERALIDF
jgi:hypothetical protein